jgi:two-component system response regulator HupR/HoxA
VRELQNEVQRAFMLADGESFIAADLLSEKIRATAPVAIASNGTLRSEVERLEVQMIRDALERCGGNQTHAAAELGLSRRGLISKLQRYGLR